MRCSKVIEPYFEVFLADKMVVLTDLFLIGDEFAIKESYAAIRSAFEKNKQLVDVDQINKVISKVTYILVSQF